MRQFVDIKELDDDPIGQAGGGAGADARSEADLNLPGAGSGAGGAFNFQAVLFGVKNDINRLALQNGARARVTKDLEDVGYSLIQRSAVKDLVDDRHPYAENYTHDANY